MCNNSVVMPKDVLKFRDLGGSQQVSGLVESALRWKRDGSSRPAGSGPTAVLLFEKPSLRTKLSFTLAVERLGGRATYFGENEVGLGRREPIADVARVVSKMVDLAIIRTFEQSRLEQFAEHADIAVVNALSDSEHPCQALADILTIREQFGAKPVKVAYVGDGNNVALSLAWAAAAAGHHFVCATPAGFNLADADLEGIADRIERTEDAEAAVADAAVVYTDAWISMGQEAEAADKLKRFAGYHSFMARRSG